MIAAKNSSSSSTSYSRHVHPGFGRPPFVIHASARRIRAGTQLSPFRGELSESPRGTTILYLEQTAGWSQPSSVTDPAVLNTPFARVRTVESKITSADQGDDPYLCRPGGRKVIYLSLLTVRAAARASASPPVLIHHRLHDGCGAGHFDFRRVLRAA